MEIKNITVIGGGRMGRQIAMNAAISGFGAVIYDVSQDVLNDVNNWISNYLSERVIKGRLTQQQADEAKSKIRIDAELASACKDADCVIEAIVEVEEEKHKLFKKLNEVIDKDVIIATNSSYMVSSKFANDIDNPSRLCNAHYYNPALVMKFVEVVQGPHTSAQTAESVYNFCKRCGKMPIWQKKEIDGFAGNYLFQALTERARYLVENGYCSVEDVDIAMEEGFHHPVGPFRLQDLTGVNLSFDMLREEYEKTGIKPAMYDTYEQMVKEGRIGRQVGHGFYDYVD